MNLAELKKKYKQMYQLNDGNYMVSTKSKEEINIVEGYTHTIVDEVSGMAGNWDLLDKDGNMIIKPNYIYPLIECGNRYQVMLPYQYKEIDGKKSIITIKHGLIDKNGNIIIPIAYLEMEAMDDTGTYFRVIDKKTQKSGIIDKNNQIIVPFQYEYIQAYPDPALLVEDGNWSRYPDKIEQAKVGHHNLYGIYDLKLKKEIIAPKYSYIEMLAYNRFLIGKDDQSCNTIIDETEKILETLKE